MISRTIVKAKKILREKENSIKIRKNKRTISRREEMTGMQAIGLLIIKLTIHKRKGGERIGILGIGSMET